MEGLWAWGSRLGMTLEIQWSDFVEESLGKNCFLSLNDFKKEKMTKLLLCGTNSNSKCSEENQMGQ